MLLLLLLLLFYFIFFAMSLKIVSWVVVFILQRSTTSSIIDLQNKLDWKQSFKTNWLLRLPVITNKGPPAFKTFSVPLRHGTLMIFKLVTVYAVSFCVQTNHMRQPLNNHTWPFYMPQFLSKVHNTVSSLSGRYDPGEHGVCRDHTCYPGYAAKPNNKGCLYPGRVLRDTRNSDLK